MKQFTARVEYNPTSLDNAIDITFTVARDRAEAEAGLAHLARQLRSANVEGLRVTGDIVEVYQPPSDLL